METGHIKAHQYTSALEIFRNKDFWNSWAIKALFGLGIGQILAGIIFFFAHNWFGLADEMKFSIVGGGILFSGLAWVVLKLDNPVAQAFGISATVLVGVMFAVFGQVYQTPALLHTPFVLWAVLTLPFAAVSRNVAHWTVWIIIALVALFAYAETGFYIAGKPLAADFLILIAAWISTLSLIALDLFIRPDYQWARAGWFRLFLLAVCCGLYISAFTATFWPWRGADEKLLSYGVSFSVLLSSLALGAYLYKIKPTLAGLTLVTLLVSAMCVQFVFKLFDWLGWDVIVFFLVFIILAGFTAFLVTVLKHFMGITSDVGGDDFESPDKNIDAKTDQSEAFLHLVGHEEPVLLKALTEAESENNPWYVETLLAFAAFVTAIFGIIFFGSFFGLVLKDQSIGYGLLILGLPLLGVSILLRKRKTQGYLRHLLNTFIVLAAAMLIGAFPIMLDSFEIGLFVTVTILVSVVCLLSVKDKIIEFISVFSILWALSIFFGQEVKFQNFDILLSFFCILLGILLLMRPIRFRLYSAAASVLLLFPSLLAVTFYGLSSFSSEAVISTLESRMLIKPLVGVLLAGGGIGLLNFLNPAFDRWRPSLWVALPILAVLILFPYGGAFAFLLIVIGYSLGHRVLALIGILLQIYYIYMFYYELSLSLGLKSYILMAVGLVCLIVWAGVKRMPEMEAIS